MTGETLDTAQHLGIKAERNRRRFPHRLALHRGIHESRIQRVSHPEFSFLFITVKFRNIFPLFDRFQNATGLGG